MECGILKLDLSFVYAFVTVFSDYCAPLSSSVVTDWQISCSKETCTKALVLVKRKETLAFFCVCVCFFPCFGKFVTRLSG